MFDRLKPFKRIFVTGPHRGGTTIATEMIAHDLGFQCMREEMIGFNNEQAFMALVRARHVKNFVLQCPAVFHLIREVEAPDTAVVFMRRSFDDLRASQDNQTYPGGAPLPFSKEEARQQNVLHCKEGEDSNEAKWRLWKEWCIRNGFVQSYEQLKTHPMWVDKSERKGWHHRQTSNA